MLALEAPSAAQKPPAGQAEQLLAPVCALNEPGAQLTHEVAEEVAVAKDSGAYVKDGLFLDPSTEVSSPCALEVPCAHEGAALEPCALEGEPSASSPRAGKRAGLLELARAKRARQL